MGVTVLPVDGMAYELHVDYPLGKNFCAVSQVVLSH